MWGGDANSKQQTLKSRGGGVATAAGAMMGGGGGGGDEESDYFPPTPRKDWSTGLLKLVTATVIFMGGVVLGLSVSGSVARYYYNASHAELFFPSTTYGCDPRGRDCGLGLAFRAFVHPPRLAHSMTDDELFWRASLVPRAEDFPFQRVPKVAFLFMTRGPIPFAPLWDKFFRGHQGLYSVYVHTVPEYKLNVSKNSAFYGRQIPSERDVNANATSIGHRTACIRHPTTSRGQDAKAAQQAQFALVANVAGSKRGIHGRRPFVAAPGRMEQVQALVTTAWRSRSSGEAPAPGEEPKPDVKPSFRPRSCCVHRP